MRGRRCASITRRQVYFRAVRSPARRIASTRSARANRASNWARKSPDPRARSPARCARHGVVLAGRPDAGDPAGGHRLEPHQAEGLVSAVGEHRVGAAQQHAARPRRPATRAARRRSRSHAPRRRAARRTCRAARRHAQPERAGAREHLGAVRLAPAARDQEGSTPRAEARNDLDARASACRDPSAPPWRGRSAPPRAAQHLDRRANGRRTPRVPARSGSPADRPRAPACAAACSGSPW